MKKRSFFRRLTGSIKLDENEDFDNFEFQNSPKFNKDTKEIRLKENPNKRHQDPEFGFEKEEEEEEEGQLTIDLYETDREVVLQTMIAGVHPENLNISITRSSMTIRGKREEARGIDDDNYFIRELYWGAFSRTIELPCEVEPEQAQATEKHGLLIITVPKIDRDKRTSLKVKSL